MHQKTIINFFRIGVGLLFLPAFLVRCASMMSPTGGPKDSLPPAIVSILPDNFTTQMKDHTKIYVLFDEFVQLKDQQKEFFTSPAMKRKPTLSIRGKGVVIQLRDTLRPNTTYALDFGSAIRDNNEGNPLYSMRYVFSTGDEIDSMLCSGYTADAYKSDSVSRTYIYFYPADSVTFTPEYDSTLFNHKPSVIGRAQNNGIFIAQNLKPIPYYIYAMQDTNDNQMYDPSVDQVGFIEGVHNPLDLPDFGIWYDSLRHYVTADPQLYFRMFTDVTFRNQSLSESSRPQQHKAMLYFNSAHPQIEELVFDSIPSDRVIIDPQTIGRDTVALWFNIPSSELPDTIRGSITYFKHDTTNTLRSTTEKLKLSWRLIESKEQEKERERKAKEQDRNRRQAEAAGEEYVPPKEKSLFGFKLPTTGDINPENHLTAEFDYPLAKIDTSSFLLTLKHEDQTLEDVRLNLRRDTSNLRRWHIEAPWQKAGEYTLTIPKGALTDIAGFVNDSIVGKYTVMDPEKFAIIKVTVVPHKEHRSRYIVQLLDGSGKQMQERRDIDSGLVVFNYVPAGEIRLRVIEDLNGNGKWDSGNLIERRQPERTEIYSTSDGKDLFTTKANWEFEQTIDMNDLFAPVTMESLSRMLEEREAQRLLRLEEERRKNQSKGNAPQGSSGMNSSGGLFNQGSNTFNDNRMNQNMGL